MADELVIDEKPTVTSDPFDGSVSPIETIKKEEPVVDNKDAIVDKKEEPVIVDNKAEPLTDDGRNYLKEKLGFEDWDTAKAEIETLKTKSQASAEIKYETLDASKIKEMYAVIDKKERLDKLTSIEVTKENAPDIIKAAMQEKYKGLTQDQVNYKFNKQFSVPKEPVQRADELDEDFEERKQDWKEQSANAEMDLLIEANLVRPELEKIKSELKLPEIPKAEPFQKELTPEELVKVQEGRALFLKDAEEALKKFAGFSVVYKDKDVEVQSTYKLSDEENAMILSKAKLYVESGFDANAIFGQRWVKDGVFDFNQFSKDLIAPETDDKRSQKFVGDASAKAKLQYIKGKHNIDLDNGNSGGDLQLEDKDLQKKKEDAIWN